MSTIKFTFGDLCAFFTRNSSRLMVGLISTDHEEPKHVHHPRITIKQNGVTQRIYREFVEINGDIWLEVRKGRPHSRHNQRSANDPRLPASLLVDIEKQLHPKEKLKVNPKLCRARLHFRNGVLYTVKDCVNVKFADAKTNEPCPHAPSETAHQMGLDIEIADGGQAVLSFSGQTDDFTFEGGQDYEVEVINEGSARQFDHFKYFYNIVRPQPEYMWIPVSGEGPRKPVPRFDTDLLCIPGGFSSALFPPPTAAAKKAKAKKAKAAGKAKAPGKAKAKGKPAAKRKR